MSLNDDLENIAFLPLDIPYDENLLPLYKEELLNCETFYSPYRSCSMVPLYTQGGLSGRKEIMSSNQELLWTKESDHCPQLRAWITDTVFPLLDPLPRVFALLSKPGDSIPAHIDCSQATFSQRQHKLRFVLSGPIDSLWFETKQEEKVNVSSRSRAYVIDGRSLHGMTNSSHEPKITVCFGSPWQGMGSERYTQLLIDSLEKHSDVMIQRNQLATTKNPELFQEHFEKQLSDQTK